MKRFFHIKTVDNRIYGIYDEITEEELKEQIKTTDWLKVYTLNFVNYLEITEYTIDIMCNKIVSIEESKHGQKYMEEIEKEYEMKYNLIEELQKYKLNKKMKFWLFIRYGFKEISPNELSELSEISSDKLQSLINKCIYTKCKKIK